MSNENSFSHLININAFMNLSTVKISVYLAYVIEMILNQVATPYVQDAVFGYFIGK